MRLDKVIRFKATVLSIRKIDGEVVLKICGQMFTYTTEEIE